MYSNICATVFYEYLFVFLVYDSTRTEPSIGFTFFVEDEVTI